ncbi:hypothetical protein B9Z55_020688 [Caenorhabditis nigoni]|uniref:DUF19 domain-containing protein n=1 Tax=Caenorhabditis nigoni TaxID=1611254 RepID=A0A2G5TNP9_9PELO|nr:hypothetical protein B9Z55_020688 [Caenorhabditis nigoni]
MFLNVKAKTTGYDQKKETCKIFGDLHIMYCDFWHGLKVDWRKNSVAWDPEQTINMTLNELKVPCDNLFVCRENSGCYQDFVNFQFLDECIDDMFELGPMELCERKLRDLRKNSPDQLADCVKTYMANNDPDKFDCVSIKEKGECFLKDVEKHCDPKFLEVYKEHQDLRLYNRACDGRLKYKDWDLTRTQEFGIHSVPGGGIKVTDPKRNETGMRNTAKIFDGLCVSAFSVLIGCIFSCL